MPTVQTMAERDEHAPLGDQLSRWVDHVLGPSFQHYRPAECWRPAVNLCEHETFFCVVVELAGMKPEQIDLRAEEGLLVLSGERGLPEDTHTPPQPGPVRVHLMEIDHGEFQRAVELPPNVDIDRIEAFYRNGYLWIRIPKTD